MSTLRLKSNDLPSTNNQTQEQFIDMVDDGNAKNVHREMCCSDVWMTMMQNCPDPANGSESADSVCDNLRVQSNLFHVSPYYKQIPNRMDVAHDMRVALSKTQPKIDKMIAKKQVHLSH